MTKVKTTTASQPLISPPGPPCAGTQGAAAEAILSNPGQPLSGQPPRTPLPPPRTLRSAPPRTLPTAAPSRSFQRRSTGPPWQALSTLRSAPPRTLRSAHPRTLRSAHPALSRGGLSAACIRLPHSALRQTLHGGRVRGGGRERKRARESERERERERSQWSQRCSCSAGSR